MGSEPLTDPLIATRGERVVVPWDLNPSPLTDPLIATRGERVVATRGERVVVMNPSQILS